MEPGTLTAIVSATIVAGTPLLIVALGELITERSGVLNLGAEGTMAVGAIAGFAAAHASGSAVVGVVAAMVAGMLMAAVFAYLVLTLLANQVASGLALAIFGVGLSAFVGKPYESKTLSPVPPLHLPVLSDLPLVGPAVFGQQWIVYFSWLLLAGVIWYLFRTRSGLVVRVVGESPSSAHSIGYPVIRIRYLATLFGGAMAGVGGACLSIFQTPLWVEGMIAGRGWIALALVVFGTWRPLRVLAGAYLFGGVMIAQLFLQGSGTQLQIPSQFLSMLPYLATIVVLVVIARDPNTIRLNSPASLGQTYRPDA